MNRHTSAPDPAQIPTTSEVTRHDPIARVGGWLAVAAALLCLAPIPLVLAVATTQTWQRGWWADGFTLEWLRIGFERIAPNAAVSLRVALITLALDLLIGLPVAWLIARRRFPGRNLIQGLATLPIAVPGIALGLALVLAYPTGRGNGTLLYAGHVLYTLPFFIGTLAPALGRRSLVEMEQVAASLGASWLRQRATVTFPQVRGAFLAAVVLVVTLSIGEFNISFFLFNPTAIPMPVELFSGYLTGRLETAAATTVWFLLLVVPAAAILERLGGAKVGQA
jgi:putative spermidine/putrescine transport system permease protein